MAHRLTIKSANRRAVMLLAVLTVGTWMSSRLHAPEGIVQAYIGPGAGIALLGSFLTIALAVLSAFAAIMTWPIRRLWLTVRGRKALTKAKVKRIVVLGLDGLEPSLVDRFMDQGLLPNMATLKDAGAYRRLGTTWPPLSPVAWSSFATGANPGKHNIFDFITRDAATYRPRMSSVRIGVPRRQLRVGRYVIPLSRAPITALRKSKTFWSVLGESGIFSAVLRVPISFPPQRFGGVELSAMCVPDLLGTQGTFIYYTEHAAPGTQVEGDVGGERIIVERNGRHIRSYLPGPVNSLRTDQAELRLPFVVEPMSGGDAAVLRINGEKVKLKINQYTDWVRVNYALMPGLKVRGICRFLLKQLDGEFQMYCTPINIDPDKPVMPISYPTVYSSYLARHQGPFATMGLAEDTWALSEQVVTEDAFLEQAYDIDNERRQMFFDALGRVRRGVVVCVFDAPDRIQHMFWRFHDNDHPALCGRANTHENTIRDMYVRMDELVGQTMAKIGTDEALFVMSDHGFKPFRRGVDLNAWLAANGYLHLKEDAKTSSQQYLAAVDWSRTKAYAIGLAGIYINQKGREAQGIVEPGDDKAGLVRELVEKLTGLPDPQTGAAAIHEAVPREKVYKGPYVDGAADIIVGYNVGYRVSWDAAVGKCGAEVISDNTKAWSGDHCVHPSLVPGILLTNLDLSPGKSRIIDLAPTILDLMGVAVPTYMDGQVLKCNDATS